MSALIASPDNAMSGSEDPLGSCPNPEAPNKAKKPTQIPIMTKVLVDTVLVAPQNPIAVRIPVILIQSPHIEWGSKSIEAIMLIATQPANAITAGPT